MFRASEPVRTKQRSSYEMIPPRFALDNRLEYTLNSSHRQAVWQVQELCKTLFLGMTAVKQHLNFSVITSVMSREVI